MQLFLVRAFVGLDQLTEAGFDSSFLNLVMVILAYLSDYYQSRGIPTALVATLAIAGYSIYLGMAYSRLWSWTKSNYYSTVAHDKYVAYGALYLMVPGLNTITPILATWLANNSEPYYRRATSIAVGFIAAASVLHFFNLIPSLLRYRLTHSRSGQYS